MCRNIPSALCAGVTQACPAHLQRPETRSWACRASPGAELEDLAVFSTSSGIPGSILGLRTFSISLP